MRYASFVIKDFKGARELSLDLRREMLSPVYALVGLNESGKTTILEAIDWFSHPEHYDEHELIPKSELLNYNGVISVTAELELSPEDEGTISRLLAIKKGFTLTQEVGALRVTREYQYSNSTIAEKRQIWDLIITGQTKKSKVRALSQSTEDPRWRSVWECAVDICESKLLPPVFYYQDFLFDFPDKIYLKLNEGSQMESQDTFYKGVMQDILNSMGRKLDVGTHLVARFESGKPYDVEAMASTLEKVASKIESEVFTEWRDLLDIPSEGLAITLGQTLEKDNKGVFLQIRVKEGDQLYYIKERSLGFRWFFFFVLLTRFRAYRHRHSKHSLFLLDEPASNLHPTAQTKLLKAFGDFPHDANILYATHSHHMINPKWLTGTFVVKNDAKKYTDVDVRYNSYMTNITATSYFRYVAENPHDEDLFRPILDALDFQPSPLELTPELIMVEGKNDYYTLRWMQEVLGTSAEIVRHIYPGTGKDKIEYVMGLYIAWGRNFVALLDDDKGGRQTRDRLRDVFGSVAEHRVFTLRDINPAWKGRAMEGLFDKADYTKVTAPIFPQEKRWNKSKFNTAIQYCLINGQRVKLHAYTIRRFTTLFEFLDQKLSDNRSS
jgi:hypothetical protein